MKDKEKLKMLRGVLGVKKLHLVGDSFMLTVPREWLMLFALKDEDGNYWVSASFERNRILIIPLSKAALAEIEIVEKK